MRTLALGALALATAACGNSDAQTKAGREPPLVTAAAVQPTRFVERIEAVGTARANEQVTLTAPVTERIVRLNFSDGEYVSRGQTIATLATGQETAQLAQASAVAREANKQLDRLEALRARGFATASAVDQQTALAGQARAQASEARASISDRVIRAPFSGYASLRNISAGAVVSAGTEIATISDISRIKLDFTVPETLLSAIAPGQPIEARSAAYPEQPFRGSIDTIDPVLNPETRAVTVRAILPNIDRKLKPGMLLTVGIESAARTSPAVPELAIVGEGQDSFVFTLDKGVARRTKVATGLRQNGMVEVTDGLRPGTRVVTEGVVKLTDGQRVRLAGAQNAQPARPQVQAGN
ncbi:efflux RND transporter periplasmic adaptor subunit [Sphingomonas gilva]|uniref:Efflux RND transporter periplasmic adaptor subunit n=1 Tax=Sphingomonas gilva TaxID=2305907 RepID=A0A396RN53_9SPHN|nr:efflux RND transporter periplasmic adaptor subunit [Sphingomonas gilva]RHW17808.1 efflux RND transporter periplasmic adaptor subunit [Sphingomonas gilva]